MNSAYFTALLALTTPAAACSAKFDYGMLYKELMAEVEAAEGKSTASLVKATQTCEALLSEPIAFKSAEKGWTVKYRGADGTMLTQNGVVIMHLPSDLDFPESCGVIAKPSESYSQIKQAFASKYGPLVTSNDDDRRLYPTLTVSYQKFSYRIRSAENPKSALSITVRHKED